jgi:uncharacterized protein involved in outer membrane biogenesis
MIKFLVRWAFRSLILLIVLIVALVLLKDTILKSIFESGITRATGMEVKIGSISSKLTRPTLTAENVVLYNTAEFGGGPFLNIPEMHLEYSPDAKGRADLRFKLVRLNLRELNIVESKEGRTNITDITAALQKVHTIKTNEATYRFNGIDTLNLTVGKVRYINLRRPERTQEMNLALQNEIIQNVRTWDDMAGLLFKILLRAGFTIYIDQPTNRPPPIAKPPPARR